LGQDLTNATKLELFASCARGLEPALEGELAALGVKTAPQLGGVAFEGDLGCAYRALLWLRSASRLLLTLRRFEAPDEAALYREVQAVDWVAISQPGATLAVDCAGSNEGLRHTRFAAQRVKDAVVDQLRDRLGRRPAVDTRDPDLRLNLHLAGKQASLSIDLGGGPLHRRGYRSGKAPAPLRESLAAGLLLLAGWGGVVDATTPDGAQPRLFCDPLCGSGTLAIEAALIAADVAPGLLRPAQLGSPGWRGHDSTLHRQLLDQARARDLRDRARPEAGQARMLATDRDPSVLRLLREGLAQVDLEGWVQVEVAKLSAYLDDGEGCPLRRLPGGPEEGPGLLLTNPPYGERLGQQLALERLYLLLGDVLRTRFGGWTAHVLSGNRALTRPIGLKAERRVPVFNGPIECRLLRYPIGASRPRRRQAEGIDPRLLRDPEGAQMLANRLRKNMRKLEPWVAREKLEAYRVYDADLPEYASAIDRYGAALHVQEYAPPPSVDEQRADDRLHDTLVVAADVLGVNPDAVHLKVRRRQRGEAQYEREDQRGERFVIREAGLRFRVDLHDFLDTGLFLDHRPTRQLLRGYADGVSFLNLFCYTASATVYAAAGGARSTTSVDLSRTYLEWAADNLGENGFEGRLESAGSDRPGAERPGDRAGRRRAGPSSVARHRLVQSDVLRWLGQAARRRERYELIFCDPPTFSASKRMAAAFDVQRDHVGLIERCEALLADDGLLVFSCNRRGFRLDDAAVSALGLEVKDISSRSIPRDFARNQKIHRCFELRRRS
jgi:23S rRNA (guanine2445-N2)-methyltransferase / 23S rRNA (guanine2069-N7)-methyltransferase